MSDLLELGRRERREVWSSDMALIYPDRIVAWETDVLVIDDWRMTVLGLVNFGETRILGRREIITSVAKPSWLVRIRRALSPARDGGSDGMAAD